MMESSSGREFDEEARSASFVPSADQLRLWAAAAQAEITAPLTPVANQAPPRELSELPPFIVPHDGSQAEIDPIQQMAAGRVFDKLFDDVMLGFAQGITLSDPTHEVPVSGLYLQTLIGDDGGGYRISLQEGSTAATASTQPGSATVRSLWVSRVFQEQGGAYAQYRKDECGIIRRTTSGVAAADQRPVISEIPNEFSIPTAEHLASIARQMKELHRNDVANAALEVQLGYQDQPVGLQEMNDLAAFVQQPGVAPVKY
jgi:hypothetical protein